MALKIKVKEGATFTIGEHTKVLIEKIKGKEAAILIESPRSFIISRLGVVDWFPATTKDEQAN